MNAQLKPQVYAERTLDTHLIKEIIIGMGADLQEDGFITEQWTPDLFRNLWLLVKQDNQTLGMFQLKQVGAQTYDIHGGIIKSHRALRHKIAIIGMEWALKNTNINKMIAQIPTCYPHVKKYTEQMGFIFEGTNRQSYLKGGKTYDKDMFGITRNEMINYIGKYYG